MSLMDRAMAKMMQSYLTPDIIAQGLGWLAEKMKEWEIKTGNTYSLTAQLNNDKSGFEIKIYTHGPSNTLTLFRKYDKTNIDQFIKEFTDGGLKTIPAC